MMDKVIHFFLQIAASTLGILVGAWLARMWDDFYTKHKRRR